MKKETARHSTRHFASDNYASVHPKIMDALIKSNSGHAPAYGEDYYTEKTREKFRTLLGDVEVHFVFNGTAANVLSLRSMIDSHESVICSTVSHINEDECGAPEHQLGVKLVTLPTSSGKITVDQIKAKVLTNGDQHKVQTKAISLTQSTELGTVYKTSELAEISKFAKKNDLYLHIDGARIANAAAALGGSLKKACAGADVLSFGGTKNGLMFGEAVVFFNKELAEKFKFYRKQKMQLASKMRFISAQFEALLTDSLWLKNAEASNQMASLLHSKLKGIPQLSILYPVDANALFIRLPNKAITRLQSQFRFYVWEEDPGGETSVVRWMTSFDTTKEDVSLFSKAVAQVTS
jgi:threonine aldolase